MSTELNKSALRQAIANFNDPANREAYFELYDSSSVLHSPGVAPGLEGIQQFYRSFWTAFPDGQLTVDEMLAEDNKVACRFTFKATHQGPYMGLPATGRRVTMTGITILHFANNKCVERWSQVDAMGLMKQLGAIPT